ncbi:MarR family winged helix-turn-helix transcriptional regulator [Psychrobacter sp.]|uniref:MarR family winged helix-turn-helix transcriptional regulator n=1 Tax=Psychrobacter TaxID=497 RepID=UPI00264EE845|nr:MarR family winged helix-turn-helix transcriptional regulator [Psychrobacter sp.]
MTKNLMSETLHQLMHTYINLLHQGIKRQELELTVTQIRTLKVVCYNPHSTAKSIADYIERDKAQITRALNDLLAADLIIKTDNPQDGRSQLLELTAKGKEVMIKLDAAEVWTKNQLTQDLTTVELALFFRVSRAMIDNVKDSRILDK